MAMASGALRSLEISRALKPTTDGLGVPPLVVALRDTLRGIPQYATSSATQKSESRAQDNNSESRNHGLSTIIEAPEEAYAIPVARARMHICLFCRSWRSLDTENVNLTRQEKPSSCNCVGRSAEALVGSLLSSLSLEVKVLEASKLLLYPQLLWASAALIQVNYAVYASQVRIKDFSHIMLLLFPGTIDFSLPTRTGAACRCNPEDVFFR